MHALDRFSVRALTGNRSTDVPRNVTGRPALTPLLRTKGGVMLMESTMGSTVALIGKLARGAACAVLLAAPAFAQGVTGTLSGTVKDAQGGVVPGAAVTLISESQGTRSVTVATNAVGDFVFPNLTTDTYTDYCGDAVLQDVEEGGCVRRFRDTRVRRHAGHRGRRRQRSRDGDGRDPLVQATSGERSFSVTTESVASLPLQNRSYFGLLALAPGVVPATGNTVVDSSRRWRRQQLHDRRHEYDGSVRQSAESDRQRRGDRRGQGPDVHAIRRSMGGRVEFRSTPSRRAAPISFTGRCTTWNAIPNGTPTARRTSSTAIRRSCRTSGLGIRIGGPAGKPGGNNKLFFYLNYERNPREFSTRRSQPVPRADAARAAGRFFTDARQQRQSVSFHQGLPEDGRVATRRARPRATPTAASWAAFRPTGCIRSGLAILKWWPEPNLPDVAGTSYNFESVYPGARRVGYQPLMRVDYQPTADSARQLQALVVSTGGRAEPGHDSRLERHRSGSTLGPVRTRPRSIGR